MCKKIVLVVPLVLVLALVASVSTSAPGKVALTDAQMSSVYGGGRDCYNSDNDGCAPVYCYLDCSDLADWWDAGCVDDPNRPDNCAGLWATSCKQVQRRCGPLSPNGSGGCTNSTTACTGTYEVWECDRTYPPDECEVCHLSTVDCAGTKLWCYED